MKTSVPPRKVFTIPHAVFDGEYAMKFKKKIKNAAVVASTLISLTSATLKVASSCSFSLSTVVFKAWKQSLHAFITTKRAQIGY